MLGLRGAMFILRVRQTPARIRHAIFMVDVFHQIMEKVGSAYVLSIAMTMEITWIISQFVEAITWSTPISAHFKRLRVRIREI